jgi:RNA polymerase sigma factor for flagellar operon FliA
LPSTLGTQMNLIPLESKMRANALPDDPNRIEVLEIADSVRVPLSQKSAAEERERVILEHLPQVRLIARRIHERLPPSVILEDLVSTGTVGLIAAVDRFNPAHNVKLKTYAEFKIRGAILDSLRSLDWAPRQQRRRAKQIELAIATVEQRLQRMPCEEEIAEQLGLTLEEYRGWLVETQGINLGSLEYASHGEGVHDLLNYISDTEENCPNRLLERAELQGLLAKTIQTMPQMERVVLAMIYHEDMTVREIAKVIDLHESRVSQLRSQAILRLRSHIAKRLLGRKAERPEKSQRNVSPAREGPTLLQQLIPGGRVAWRTAGNNR